MNCNIDHDGRTSQGEVTVWLWREDVTDQCVQFTFVNPTAVCFIYGQPDQGLIVRPDDNHRAELILKDGTVHAVGIEAAFNGMLTYQCPMLALMN